jgi:YHS domain-containing protein
MFCLRRHRPEVVSRRSISLAGFAALVAMTDPGTGTSAVATSDTTANMQFGGQSAQALSEGKHLATPCTVRWTDADGKVYCFDNESAKQSFLKNPEEKLQRARAFMAASNVESTEKAMQNFQGSDAAALVKDEIERKSRQNNGVFPYTDSLNGDQLKLSFDAVDFVRTIDGYGFFPIVNFHDAQDPQKKFQIDFWVQPEEGKLQVQEVRIHKAPVQSEGKWISMTRDPVAWWWIPASEHPGHMAEKRGWEVMSAVEQNAMSESRAHHGTFKIKDDKTGKVLELEFVGTHQPVRQLDDGGHYFACTDFRVVGTRDQIYDIDFWVNDRDGAMSVDQVKVHKVPELKSGQWVQIPRYEWKDLGASHVVP